MPKNFLEYKYHWSDNLRGIIAPMMRLAKTNDCGMFAVVDDVEITVWPKDRPELRAEYIALREEGALTFTEYEARAWSTAIYPDRGRNLIYPTLGLCGEAGEVAEKVKKHLRDGTPIEELRTVLCKELGDVLWYINALAHELGLPLADIARENLRKLLSRQERGKLHGSGDDR